MKIQVTPELKKWLQRKKIDTLNVSVLICRGGCCGGAGHVETLIYQGEPRKKPEKYLIFEEDGFKVYVAQLLERKTSQLTLGLKGKIFKRPVLENFDSACS